MPERMNNSYQHMIISFSHFTKCLLLILLLIISIFIQAQESEFEFNDSLVYRFDNDTTFTPDERLDLALTLSSLFEKNNPEKAKKFYVSAIEIAKSMKDNSRIKDVELKRANFNNVHCNYVEAESSYLKVFNIISKHGDTAELAQIHYLMADNYYDWSKYILAKTYYEKALLYYQKTNDKSGIASTYIGLSSIASNSGDYETAIQYMEDARENYEQIGDVVNIAGTSLGLGVIMANWDRYDKALEYYNSALESYRNTNNNLQEINILLHIGDVFLKKKQYESALKYFNQALNLEINHPNAKLRSICYSNMGEVYFEIGEFQTALNFQERALVIKYEVGDKKRIAISLLNIGNIFFAMANYDQALLNATDALSLSREISLKNVEVETLKLLADICYEQGNFKMAFDYLNQYIILKDEVFDIESREMFEGLMVKYEADRIERENEILKQRDSINTLELDRQKNSNLIAFIIIIFIVVFSIAFIIFFQIKANQQKRNYAVLAKKNKEITEQKEVLSRLNNELIYSQERYRSIVENATIGMYQTLPNGSVKFANNSLVEMLGYSNLEELKTKINLNRDHPRRKLFIKLLEKEHIISGREDVWIRQDGSEMYVNESAWIVYDHDGEVLHFEGMVEDITSRKEIEIALKKSQEDLVSINSKLIISNKEFELAKNEAIAANEIKSQFIANVSHEIRTPMNSIIGFTDLLSKKVTDKKLVTYIDAIGTSSKNLLAIINDILDLSKVQANEIELHHERVAFSDIISDIENLFKLQFSKKGITFKTSVSNDIPHVFIDKIRIQQVILNLVANALKFTEDGSVSIEVYCNRYTDKLDLFINVTDTGRGINESDFDKIFEAFKQSGNDNDNFVHGTGLGLNISKMLTEAMGGKISLTSSVGEGSVFTVHIPNLSIAYNENQKVVPAMELNSDKVNEFYDEYEIVSYEILNEIDDSIRVEIQNKFGGQFQDILNTQVINDIVEFTKKLHDFSESIDDKALKRFSSSWLFSAENFDIENLNKYMSVFNKVIFDK